MKQLKSEQKFKDFDDVIKTLKKKEFEKIEDDIYKISNSVYCLIADDYNKYNFEKINSLDDKWFLVFENLKNNGVIFKGVYSIEMKGKLKKFKLVTPVWNS